jgi:chaperonin cofactor prefoldin
MKMCEIAIQKLEDQYKSSRQKLIDEFEDTKGVIKIRISKKNRQHNGQKKKYKRTNNDLQNIHSKLNIE